MRLSELRTLRTETGKCWYVFCVTTRHTGYCVQSEEALTVVNRVGPAIQSSHWTWATFCLSSHLLSVVVHFTAAEPTGWLNSPWPHFTWKRGVRQCSIQPLQKPNDWISMYNHLYAQTSTEHLFHPWQTPQRMMDRLWSRKTQAAAFTLRKLTTGHMCCLKLKTDLENKSHIWTLYPPTWTVLYVKLIYVKFNSGDSILFLVRTYKLQKRKSNFNHWNN